MNERDRLAFAVWCGIWSTVEWVDHASALQNWRENYLGAPEDLLAAGVVGGCYDIADAILEDAE